MIWNSKISLIVFISVLSVCAGVVDLSCDKVNPVQPSTLKCTCRNTNGDGVLWYKDDKYITDCYLKSQFCVAYPGFLFAVNNFTYTFYVDFYNYSRCDVYTCRDLYLHEVNDTKRIAARDSTSISILNISEPTANHTSGFIGVTTECIYGASSEENYKDIQWLLVKGNVEKHFNPVNTTIMSLCRSCRLCDGDSATQFLTGFYHKEEMGCQGKEAKFRIILRHSQIPTVPLNITTKNVYCVSETTDGSGSMMSTIYILVIVFPLLIQYSVLGLIYKFIHRKRNTNTPGKLKSSSTKLESGNWKDKYFLLAFVPALGFIGIILWCCCTNTEGTSTDVVIGEKEEEKMEMLSEEPERKEPNHMNNGCPLSDHTAVQVVIGEKEEEKMEMLSEEPERKEPNHMNNGCPLSDHTAVQVVGEENAEDIEMPSEEPERNLLRHLAKQRKRGQQRKRFLSV